MMLKVVLLITIYSCNILTHPVLQELPNYNGVFKNDDIPLKPLGSNNLENEVYIHKPGGSKDLLVPLKPLGSNHLDNEVYIHKPGGPKDLLVPLKPLGSNHLDNEVHMHKPESSKDRIVLPVKYHYDDRLAGTGELDNNINLPTIRQPYKNYKVLVATAPAGLDLDEDNKPMSIYVVFNDDNNYQSPMDLPTVYFVKKSSHNDARKVTEPIFLVDSNRTVTGLRSKEIQKFVKFRNKLTNRFFRNSNDSDV